VTTQLLCPAEATLGPVYDAVVLLSGGLDSSVLLARMQAERRGRLLGLHFQLASRSPELRAARHVARLLAVPLRVIDARPFMCACETRREPHHLLFGSFVLFGMALSFANEHGIGTVVAGVNRCDAESEAEHSPEFFTWMEHGLRLLGAQVKLSLPFQDWPKAQIVREGALVDAPLGRTWSCVMPMDGMQDGVCHACVERRDAFRLAGVSDPTRYARGRVVDG